MSRNGNDLTERFAEVAREVVKATKSPNAVLDGEVVPARQRAAARASRSCSKGRGPLVYYAFDLLELDGESLLDLPLVERKERLRRLLDGRNRTGPVLRAFRRRRRRCSARRVEQGLEGIIAKRPKSRYAPGRRTRDWLKIKVHGEQEFVVAGYTRGAGRRAGTFGSLVLAVNDGKELRYVGNVGTGFGDAEIGKLLKLLKPLHRDTAPFAVEPKMPKVRKGDVQWVEPRLVAQVRFTEWTHDGHLRHPAYLGLRDDKPAGEVTRERPVSDVVRRGKRELRVSNLDKLFWPEEGITKGDLLALLRGGRARARAAPEEPAVHDAPLSRRRVRARRSSRRTHRATCPSGSRRSGRSSRPGRRSGRRNGSSSRSSTTISRCSGWSTWAAST